MRTDRKFDETRTVKITDHYLMSPQGSVLIEMGNTKVICTASVAVSYTHLCQSLPVSRELL